MSSVREVLTRVHDFVSSQLPVLMLPTPRSRGPAGAELPRETAGVLAPPPVFPLAIIALSELLRWLSPLPLRAPTHAWRWVLVAALCGVALALAGSALWTLRRARTPVEPWKPTRAVVMDGPYAISRNPIYVAFLAMQVAYAWARPNVWGILLLPLTIALLHWGVIAREERYLAKRFGEAYASYARRVRRWV